MCSWSDLPSFSGSDPILWDTEGNDILLEGDHLTGATLGVGILLLSNLRANANVLHLDIYIYIMVTNLIIRN